MVTSHPLDYLPDWGYWPYVSSPLGAWLLLAVVDPDPQVRRAAAALLSTPHPNIRLAAATWGRRELLDRLPARSDRVSTGPVPDQAGADQWTSEQTDRRIDRFPLRTVPQDALVLASAVTAKTTWSSPLATISGDRLGGAFGAQIFQALLATDTDADISAYRTPAGLMAAVRVKSIDPIAIVCVMPPVGTRPNVAIASAWDIAAAMTRQPTRSKRVPWAAAGLEGHCWVSEPAARDSATAILPAWEVRARHNITSATGFPDLAERVSLLFSPDERPASMLAAQSAYAKFGKAGFEAAAVTAAAFRTSNMAVTPTGGLRATVRFDRPFVAVALATGPGPWAGVPLFAAEITEPVEA